MRKDGFSKRLLALAVPIALQQLLTQAMYLLDSVMIGSLGQNEIIAVSAAGQITFVFNIVLYGIAASGVVFTSQFFGKNDEDGIKKTLSTCLMLALMAAAVFGGLVAAFPKAAISIVNPEPAIVEIGAPYIRIVAISFIASAVTMSLNSSLKGMNLAKVMMCVSVVTLVINGCINYTLIFGKFGAPKMGVAGAAVGTAVAFSVEALIMLIYYLKKSPVKMKLSELLRFPEKSFMHNFWKVALPILMGETLWGVGNLLAVMLYNRLGLAMAGAMAVFIVVEKMCYVVYSGVANASAVLIGQCVGAGEEDKAKRYAGRCLAIGPVLAIVMGALVILCRGGIMSLYSLTPEAVDILTKIFYFTPLTWAFAVYNFVSIAGILRGAGDTRFATKTDLCCTYIGGIGLAYLAGLVLKLPPPYVYLVYMLGAEVAKAVIGLVRFKSGKWVHNITKY